MSSNLVAVRSDGTLRNLMVNVSEIVEDVYSKPLRELKAPDGYEFTGEFRTPSKGDAWLPAEAHPSHPCFPCFDTQVVRSPRLILRKKPKLVGYTFRIVRVEPPYGSIKPGEWFSTGANPGIINASGGGCVLFHNSATVYEREEIYG